MILVGDTHFGVKRFNQTILEQQLEYLKEVVILAKDKNKQIFQLGDVFDNRVTCDINFLNEILKFFDFVKEQGVVFNTLLGNHDIYYRHRLDVNLSSVIARIYPDNFKLYEKNTIIDFYDKKILVVPWLVRDAEFPFEMMKEADAVFGHLEINGFEMVKGHTAEEAHLNKGQFKKPVFTGHFHIKNDKGLVKYIGTPYQITWNDFNENKGVFILNPDLSTEFIENLRSPRFVQLHYDSSKAKPLEVIGLKKKYSFNLDDLRKNKALLSYNKIKFIIHTSDSSYEDFLFILRDAGIDFEVVNKFRIDEIEVNDVKISNTKDIILSFLKENHAHYIEEITGLIGEINED